MNLKSTEPRVFNPCTSTLPSYLIERIGNETRTIEQIATLNGFSTAFYAWCEQFPEDIEQQGSIIRDLIPQDVYPLPPLGEARQTATQAHAAVRATNLFSQESPETIAIHDRFKAACRIEDFAEAVLALSEQCPASAYYRIHRYVSPSSDLLKGL